MANGSDDLAALRAVAAALSDEANPCDRLEPTVRGRLDLRGIGAGTGFNYTGTHRRPRAPRERILFPKNVIRGQVTAADREINLIDEHLFHPIDIEVQRLLNRPGERIHTRVASDSDAYSLSETAKSKFDNFRYVSARYWSYQVQEKRENFLKINFYTDPGWLFGYPIPFDLYYNRGDETFLKTEDGQIGWTSVIKLDFISNRVNSFTNNLEDFPPYAPAIVGSLERFVRVYLWGTDEPGGGPNSNQLFDDSLHERYRQPLVQFSQDFEDNVFSSEIPFYKAELDRMDISQFTSVDIKLTLHSFEELEKEKEVHKVNLYRHYNKTIVQPIPSSSDHENCKFKDKIQKFTCENVLRLDEANESLKNTFSKYIEININTQQLLKVASFLHETRMDKHILELITKTPPTRSTFAEIIDETIYEKTIQNPSGEEATADHLLGGAAFENDSYTRKVTRDVWDVDFSPDKMERIEEYTGIDLNHYPMKFEGWDSRSLLRFHDIIRSQVFMNRLESHMYPDKVRSYCDILDGEKAYSEIIGYKICKHKVNSAGQPINPPLQEYYFMDSDDIKTINFVDTQINSEVEYVYRIYSINFVAGSKYRYGDRESRVAINDTVGVTASVDLNVFCAPSFKIILAPFFERKLKVLDKPPMFPQVSFLPLQGKEDKMQILIQSNFGERKEYPIEIYENNHPDGRKSDREIIQKMRTVQEASIDGKIHYKNDSMPRRFEIIRICRVPTTYKDFADIDTSIGEYNKVVDSLGRSYLWDEENFRPNKDYYYIFRAIDDRGISNPTEVYRVKLVSYENGIFLDMEAHEMEPPDESLVATAERYIEIKPSNIQRTFKFEEDMEENMRQFKQSAEPLNVTLGNNETNSVWGRKFKLRLISKTSGRKIDINFEFNNRSDLIPPPDSETPPPDSDDCPGLQEIDLSAEGLSLIHISEPTRPY